MVIKKCRYCNNKIVFSHWREFACHCASCKSNPNVVAKYKKAVDTLRKKLYAEYNFVCPKCDKPFKLSITKNRFLKKDYRKFCSRSCANSKAFTEETKNKIRSKLTKIRLIKCLNCNKETKINQYRSNRVQMFCSVRCAAQYRSKKYLINISAKKRYTKECKFNFNVWDYPEEFDLNSIYKYGWYKAKNKGDNVNGISRDHMISINYGYSNNIDSKIMSHPANCRLLRHKQNVSKLDKCSITVNELQERIKIWNGKYRKTETQLTIIQ